MKSKRTNKTKSQLQRELAAAQDDIFLLKCAGTYAIYALQPKDPSNLSFIQSEAVRIWLEKAKA